jgi:hypothetical protein
MGKLRTAKPHVPERQSRARPYNTGCIYCGGTASRTVGVVLTRDGEKRPVLACSRDARGRGRP